MQAADTAPAGERIRAGLRPVILADGTRAQRADVAGGHAVIHAPDPPLSPLGYEGGVTVELYQADGTRTGRMRCRDLGHAIQRLAWLEDQ